MNLLLKRDLYCSRLDRAAFLLCGWVDKLKLVVTPAMKTGRLNFDHLFL